jgi:hypothetical protein
MTDEAVGMDSVVAGLDVLMDPREGSIAMERGSGETPWFAYVLDLSCYDQEGYRGLLREDVASELSSEVT